MAVVHESLQLIIDKHHEDKLSHAFLIETNNFEKAIIDVKEVIKEILVDYSNNENDLSKLIDLNNLPSLIIIEPDGASIKKGQIQELKSRMQTKPVYTDRNVYVIKNAEKLNPSSANTMLKFIEEPEEGLLGFFITDNKDKMLPTIKSRTQLITANYDLDDFYNLLNITEQEFEKHVKILSEYLKLLETDFESCLLSTKDLVLSEIKERLEVSQFFLLMLKVYENNLNKLLGRKIDSHYEVFNFISETNDIPKIIKKLKIIENTISNLNYNPNLELLFDRFVIEMRCEN